MTNIMKKYITRHKALIIPFIIDKKTNQPHYVMVKDRRTQDWGFISGGVKKNESSEDAARRELQEESSNLLFLPTNNIKKYSFTSSYRPEELAKIDKRRHEIVRSSYTMYLFKLPNDIETMKNELRKFRENTECTGIDINPYTTFEKIWVFSEEVYRKCKIHNKVVNFGFKKNLGQLNTDFKDNSIYI